MTRTRKWGCSIGIIALVAPTTIGSNPVLAGLDEGCGTTIKPHEKEKALAGIARAQNVLPGAMLIDTITVPVSWHILRHSNGTGGKNPSELQGHIEALNEAYEAAGIQFCTNGAVKFIDSTSWYNSLPSDSAVDLFRTTDSVPNSINIYWAPTLKGGSLCGKSSFTFSDVQGIAMQTSCQGTEDVDGVLVHEIGHYFDLFHTFESAFGWECVNGSNCSTAGDLLCDTPASFGVQFDFCVQPGTCQLRSTCSQELGPCFGDGFYNPDVLNFMSYSVVNCLSSFTPQQAARARATLLNSRTELHDFICTIPCLADLSGDGKVGVNDLLSVIGVWGPCDCSEDLDDSGAVGVDDLLAVIQAWGDCSSG